MTITQNILRNNQPLLEEVLGRWAFSSVCFWGVLLISTTILFAAKQPITIANGIMALGLTVVFTFFWRGEGLGLGRRVAASVAGLMLFGLSFGLAVYGAGKVFDLSYDGQAYHQEAVIQLDHKWNPVYMMLDGEATANLERWLNHYPKGVWLMAASIYKLTGNIEAGKAWSIYAGVLALVTGVWALYREKMSWVLKVLVSAALAFNPVYVYQSLSYYVDGVMVSMLLCLAYIGFRYIRTREKYLFWPYLFTFVVAVNIKLSAVVYVAMVTGGLIMYSWFSDKLRTAWGLIKMTLVALVVGMLFVGYNPYVTNFVTRGHLLYPAMGRGAYNYVPTNVPGNLWSVPAPVRLILSIFSKPSLARGEGQSSELKIPFVFPVDSLAAFRETNAKTGGFGPLFEEIFILSVLLGVLGVILLREQRRGAITFAAVVAILLGSASAVATSNVARYVPHVWWIPGVVGFYLSRRGSKAFALAAGLLMMVMMVNTAVVAYVSIPYGLSQSQRVGQELDALTSQREEGSLTINVGQYGSAKIKLEERGVRYREVMAGEKCEKKTRLMTGSVAVICETR